MRKLQCTVFKIIADTEELARHRVKVLDAVFLSNLKGKCWKGFKSLRFKNSGENKLCDFICFVLFCTTFY